MEDKLPLVLFDNDCALCIRFRQAVERLDSEQLFHFHPLQDETIYEHFTFISKTNCEKEIHVVLNSETALSGKEALEYMIKQLPAIKKFAWLIETDMGQKSLDFFHEISNKYREKIKRMCPGCSAR